MIERPFRADSCANVLRASADASVRFALACLEPVGHNLRAKSSFVDPDGAVMHWHDFGDLEGPGWAANAIGGAHLLYRWGQYQSETTIQERALRLIDHVLQDGFIRADGFIWPYWHLGEQRFCLNYTHQNDWLCPGSLARIGVQMIECAIDLDDLLRADRLRRAAHNLANWLQHHVSLLPNGWAPRRITLDGQPFDLSPHGSPDPIYDHSADGLFLLHLWALTGHIESAQKLGDAFVAGGGFWGSINHDTFDDHENVAYAVAWRTLKRCAGLLNRPAWSAWVDDRALPVMQQFRMNEDRNGVITRGLFWMEASWDTAYLWENAEIAQAYLEAWLEQKNDAYLDMALDVLLAMAQHHYGGLGFLSEGIDWNNHVGRQHHIDGEEYGAIAYTEPLLNNLHLVGPTLTWLQAAGFGAGRPSQAWSS